MSYNAYEQSDYSGHPLELYRFALGETVWLFTSADHEIAWGDDTYQPIYIHRGGFTKGGDTRKATMEIEVAATNPVAIVFRSGWVAMTMIVTVYRHHHGDSEFSVLWKGRVTGCKWSGSTATLSSENVSTLLRRSGLRRTYQVGCPHVLFGDMCGVDADAYEVAATVSDVNGNLLTLMGIGGYASGHFLGGVCKFGSEYRMITAHSAGSVTLVDSISGLIEGAAVTLWPGCARTVNACANKFDNIDNYGGLPYLPSKNPFSGDALV